MIQNLSLREGTTKQSQGLVDSAIASFPFASFAMTIGHFITWSTLTTLYRKLVTSLVALIVGWVEALRNPTF
jgi:hypothetical protein